MGGFSGLNNFIDYPTWLAWITEAAEELYQLMLASGAGESMWGLVQNFTITSGNSVTLIATESGDFGGLSQFRQLVSLTKDPGTPQRRTVHRYVFAERDSQHMEPRYRLLGNKLYIEPEEQALGSYRLTLLAGPTNWVTGDDDDQLRPEILEDWREFIMISAAIKALSEVEGTNTSELEQRLEVMRQEITDYCSALDSGEPGKVTDASNDGTWYDHSQ